jgi:hypothetical protein
MDKILKQSSYAKRFMILTGHLAFLMQTAGLNFNDKFDILLKMRSNPGAEIAEPFDRLRPGKNIKSYLER